MRKTLLTLCLALIAVFAMGQKVTLDFTDGENVWGLPNGASNKVTTATTFTNGTYSITVDASNGAYYFSTNKTLLMGKQGATLTLPIFDFSVGKIVLKANGGSGKVTQNIYVGEDEASTSVTGIANDATFVINSKYQAAGTQYVLKITNANNSQFTAIEIYEATGAEKTTPGLSWGTASRTATIGADNSFPTLTNENNVDVTYSSSNTDVATISTDGSITLVAEGTTTISATFDGNDTYDKQTVSYTLTVKAQSQEPTTDIANTAETAYTVAKAVELIEAGEGLSATVFVKGIISKVESFNSKYGSLTYWISDDGTETSQQFECYSGLNIGGAKFNGVEDLSVGSSVIVKGVMKKYTPKEGDPIYEFNYNNEIVSISSNINSITVSAANVPAYNIAGQRVNANASGIVVRNGRKYINK